MIELVARQYPHLSRDAACQQAISVIATMVGSIILARATNRNELAGRILSAGRKAVLDTVDDRTTRKAEVNKKMRASRSS
jgi:hypothetical protein